MEKIIRGYMVIGFNNIIHKDLKPENIFIKNNQIKIGNFEFDFYKYLKNNVKNFSSQYYMSPQVLQNFNYSFKSDIWSLGVIYYETLFGTKPWIAS